VSAWAELAVAAIAVASAAATTAAVLFWLAELVERTARAVANWIAHQPRLWPGSHGDGA